jgi:hypothetical protein
LSQKYKNNCRKDGLREAEISQASNKAVSLFTGILNFGFILRNNERLQ